MPGGRRKRDIEGRAFAFARRILALCDPLIRRGGSVGVIGRQLARSGSSIGANLEEAVGAQSKPDFIAKTSVALKESRESHYWLRLLECTCQPVHADMASLRQEAGELVAILRVIVRNARSSSRRG